MRDKTIISKNKSRRNLKRKWKWERYFLLKFKSIFLLYLLLNLHVLSLYCSLFRNPLSFQRGMVYLHYCNQTAHPILKLVLFFQYFKTCHIVFSSHWKRTYPIQNLCFATHTNLPMPNARSSNSLALCSVFLCWVFPINKLPLLQLNNPPEEASCNLLYIIYCQHLEAKLWYFTPSFKTTYTSTRLFISQRWENSTGQCTPRPRQAMSSSVARRLPPDSRERTCSN